MGKQRNSYDSGFKQMYDEVMSGNISDKTKKIFKNNPLNQNTYENDEINLKNQDYLKGDENPYTYQGGLDLNQNDPFNEIRANNQSGLDHLGIGLVRAGAKAAVEVAKLPGVIGGIGIMAADGLTGGNLVAENEGFETAFNNQWIKFFDGLDENVKDALPVYTKEAVKNGDFFDKISSSAFWATDGADGAGFMLGMLAPGAIFKWAGGAEALFGASIKVAKLAKYGEDAQAASKFLEKAGITIKNIDQTMIPAFNTISEAGSEAKGVSDDMDARKGEFVKDYPNQQLKALQELDVRRRNGEINIDEYNKLSNDISNKSVEEAFKEQKALAMQNTFLKNVAVLAVPNYIQAKLLFGKTPSKVLLDKIGGEIEKEGFWQGAKKIGKRVGESFLSEGSEEVAQTAIQHRNTDEGIKGKLGDDRFNDYSPLTFGSDFVKTLGTTEGQISGFLGGMMGAPVELVMGHYQDIADRKETVRLREKINGASTAYSDIRNTDLYEKEQYTNPETGQVDTRDKVVDGKKVLIPEAVAKVKNALDLTEKQGQIYDKAVQEGDTETLEYLKGQGEFNLIQNFIGEDEVTLDALHEYLKVAFPTETSKDVSKDQIKINKENTERVDNIMKKAKSLQKDLTSYKDMATSLIRINNPNVTKEHLADFMNRVANTFLSERAEEFDAKEKLNKLEKQRNDLEANTPIIETENPNYIEGTTEDIFKTIKSKSENPRLELVNKQIDKVKEQLKSFSEATNSTIWDNKFLNNKINNEVIAKEKLQKATSPEEVAKNNKVINKTKNATTVDEVKEIEKTSPKETIENPAIKEQIDNKKAELKKAKEDEESGVISNAKEDDNAFNGTSTTDTISTEGSEHADSLHTEEGENRTIEDEKDANNDGPNSENGRGAKVISYNRVKGEVFDWIKKQFPEGLAFERNPVNKVGNKVGFEVNLNPGTGNENVTKALKQFQADNFNDLPFLIDYLPINIKLAEGAYLPIETRRKAEDEKGNPIPGEMKVETGKLRTNLITALKNGTPIEDLNSTINYQYKGILQVDGNRYAENNILDLAGVADLKYVRENIYFVNIHGQLENVLTGQIQNFKNKFGDESERTKDNAKGEIYLMIPQADGVSQYPLKLNIKKVNENEATLLYYIYKELLTNNAGLNTTLSEVNPEVRDIIISNFQAELKIIGGNVNDIKIKDLVDLLIYQSDNDKSRMMIDMDANGNPILLYSDGQTGKVSTADTIKDDMGTIIDYLVNHKRHQIKIRTKKGDTNTKTNLSSNSKDYIEYLVNNKILSTNAVVNEPAFQGYTNLFVSSAVEIKESKKVDKQSKVKEYTEAEVIERLKGIRTIQELSDGFKTLSKEQQELYKPLFTEKRIEIENKGKVKVSDAGAEIASNNFEGLDFGDNNSNNVRNIENNFVSLQESTTVVEDLSDSNKFVSSSDIPNTVENKQSMEKQKDVFENAPKAISRDKDTKTIVLLKARIEAGTAKESHIRQYEELKQKYGEEFVKKCN